MSGRLLAHRAPRMILIVLVVAGDYASRALAQTVGPGGERIIHESWTFKQGAPEAVHSLAQTTDGYLWLGTPTGLYRFDGVRFELFRPASADQLLSTDVTAVFAPARGGLWIGYLFGGFSLLKNGRLTNFPAMTGTVFAFAEDQQGIVWAATNTRTGGLWRFETSSWQNIKAEWNGPDTRVSQLGFDRQGILWALTEARGAEARKQLFLLPPGGRQFRAAGSVSLQSFTWDANRLVVTSPENSAGDGDSSIDLQGTLPAYPILRPHSEQLLDRTNAVWAIPLEGPVLRHPASGSLPEVLSTMSSANSEVFDINANRFSNLLDREGSVWIGDQTGVHRFSYSPLVQQELENPPGPFLTVVPDDGGAVWISAGSGDGLSTLYRVRDGKIEVQHPQGGVTNLAYRAADKTLWFGGEGGLWHMREGRLDRVALPQETADNAMLLRSVADDGSGGVWVSFGPPGLYRFKDGIWAKYGGRSDLPTSGVVIAFTDTLRRVWFGSTQDRLAVLDGDRVQTFGPGDGVEVGTISAIHGRGPAVWIGGDFGLQQFDGGRFRTIHAVDRESLRGIVGILERANGDLWLNGLSGIVHLRQADLLEALKNPAHLVTTERFSRREGLPGLARFGPIAAVEGSDGRLWFPVRNGVVWLDPTRSSTSVPPPPVTIQSISADDRGYSLEQPLRFPARTSNVHIGYSAVSLYNPEAIRFRYRLRETDHDWQEVGATNSVTYRNLLPGSYHFAVSATDTNGSWSDTVATTEFTILPTFYQTNSFRALLLGLFAALMWAAYQLRMRQVRHAFALTLEARVGERTRIARELHDTLLQSFHGVALRLETVSQLLPRHPAKAQETLDSTIRQVAEAITQGRDAVQGLRVSTLQSNDLGLAISALGEELATGSPGHRPLFRVAVEGRARDLRPILRDETCKIAAEALRNAFQHAQARQIEVEIRYDDAQFRLRVRDDGKGIDPALLSNEGREGHFGLSGMRERATLIGGELTIWSKVDTGSEVELRVSASTAYAAGRTRSQSPERSP